MCELINCTPYSLQSTMISHNYCNWGASRGLNSTCMYSVALGVTPGTLYVSSSSFTLLPSYHRPVTVHYARDLRFVVVAQSDVTFKIYP